MNNVEHEIVYLRAKLAESEDEIYELSDQLNCFILIAKSALLGDEEALNHLKKIVSINRNSPDASQEAKDQQGNIQHKAIRNWALLTSNLLYKDYKAKLRSLKEESLKKLAQRSAYLDEVREVQTKQAAHAYLSKKIRPTSGLIRPSRVTSQTRPNDLRTNTPENGHRIVAADFFDDTDNPTGANFMAQLHKNNVADNAKDAAFNRQQYDSSHRYEQPGLFDPPAIIKTSRPVSASSIKSGDQRRSRPKSGVVESGRPLKYEAVRPSVSSAKKVQSRSRSAKSAKSTEGKNNEKEKLDPIQVFSNELKRVADMEDEFKAATINLQRKIGIHPDGFIAP